MTQAWPSDDGAGGGVHGVWWVVGQGFERLAQATVTHGPGVVVVVVVVVVVRFLLSFSSLV